MAKIEQQGPEFPYPFTWKKQTKTKPDNIYETVMFKTLGISQQKIAIPQRWETIELNPKISPS